MTRPSFRRRLTSPPFVPPSSVANAQNSLSQERDRWFESGSRQRRVVRTMVTAATWSRTAASVSRLSLVSCFQVTSTPWGSDSSATGATPTLPTSASKATAFHVWLRRSAPAAEHLMRCPSCMAENTATRRFCAQCGTPLPSPCPSCGFENEPSARFCGGCGKPPARFDAPSGLPASTVIRRTDRIPRHAAHAAAPASSSASVADLAFID